MPEKEEAIMAKYDVTFSCGHTATVQLFGKEADRQRSITWYEENGLCPECYKKKIEAERKAADDAAAAEAKEMGLPDLKGSEKQVAWANSIRGAIVNEVNNCLGNAYKEQKRAEKEDKDALLENVKRVINLLNAINEVIASETSAHEIIGWRNSVHINDWCYEYQMNYDKLISGSISRDSIHDTWDSELLDRALDLLLDGKTPDQEAEEAEVAETVVLSPEHKESGTPVTVAYTDKEVSVESPKDSGVIETAKGCGFRWDGDTWTMQIDVKTGSAVDRAAEIANKLLLAGYQVTVPVAISQAAVSGSYELRCTRWICSYSDDEEHVYLSWDRNDDMYYKALELTGAKWRSRRGMRVPTSSADEIEDFAQLYGFQITDDAKEAIAEYRKSVTIVAPESGKPAEKKDGEEALDSILQSSREVLEDLKDE